MLAAVFALLRARTKRVPSIVAASKRRRMKRNAMRFIIVNKPAFLVDSGTVVPGAVGSADGGFRVE